MKKTGLLLTTLLLSTVVLGGVTASAADYGTDGLVQFEQDTTPNPPVNPEDPEDPVDPVDPPDDPTDGPLSIDFASKFNFGLQKISGQDQTYHAALQEYTGSTPAGPNYVQVTDKTGEYNGWDLTLKQEAQFMKGSTTELTGAAITIDNITANSLSTSTPGTIERQMELVPGTAHPIVAAAVGEGKGTWAFRFGTDAAEGAESVSLFVPASSNPETGDYTTELTWTLTAGTPAP